MTDQPQPPKSLPARVFWWVVLTVVGLGFLGMLVVALKWVVYWVTG